MLFIVQQLHKAYRQVLVVVVFSLSAMRTCLLHAGIVMSVILQKGFFSASLWVINLHRLECSTANKNKAKESLFIPGTTGLKRV